MSAPPPWSSQAAAISARHARAMPNTAENCALRKSRRGQHTHKTDSRTLPRRLQADRRHPTPRPGSVSLSPISILLELPQTTSGPVFESRKLNDLIPLTPSSSSISRSGLFAIPFPLPSACKSLRRSLSALTWKGIWVYWFGAVSGQQPIHVATYRQLQDLSGSVTHSSLPLNG